MFTGYEWPWSSRRRLKSSARGGPAPAVPSERPAELFDLEQTFLRQCDHLEQEIVNLSIARLDLSGPVSPFGLYEAVTYLRDFRVFRGGDAASYAAALRIRSGILLGEGSQRPTWEDISRSLAALETLETTLRERIRSVT